MVLIVLAPLASADPDRVGPPPPDAPAQRVGLAVLAEAQAWVGAPYRWSGRDTERLPGVDCLGLLFLAHARVTGGSWRSYPVDPHPLVASGKLGLPVAGVSAALRGEVPVGVLAPGDVLYFLLAEVPIPDEPLWTREGVRYWPWHTGLYVGGGRTLQATPGGVVEEVDLYGVSWDALNATRPR